MKDKKEVDKEKVNNKFNEIKNLPDEEAKKILQEINEDNSWTDEEYAELNEMYGLCKMVVAIRGWAESSPKHHRKYLTKNLKWAVNYYIKGRAIENVSFLIYDTKRNVKKAFLEACEYAWDKDKDRFPDYIEQMLKNARHGKPFILNEVDAAVLSSVLVDAEVKHEESNFADVLFLDKEVIE